MTAPSQLRVLTLHEKEHSSTIFRLEKGWTLHFRLGPSLAGKEVRVFVNHPKHAKDGPNRHSFRELPWESYTKDKVDLYDNFAEVNMVLAGSFNYFFTIYGSDQQDFANGSGYFLVDPILKVGRFDEKLPLNAVCCQTVLSKNLGPFPEWEERLRVAKETGYNMIHFTPIQELGKSHSAYCLKEQLCLNPIFSIKDKKFGFNDIDNLVKMMQNDWEVLSLTDLVFNHTANESPWIQEHPECSYNLINSPHLRPSFLLDRILWHFSTEVAEGKWEVQGIPAALKTEEHLENIRRVLADDILPKYKIQEYFLMDVDEVMLRYKAIVLSSDVPYKKESEEQKNVGIVPHPEWTRLKASVSMETAVQEFYACNEPIQNIETHRDQSCRALRARLEQLNQAKLEEIQSHLEAAVNNVVANARWRFVDSHGAKIPKVLVDDEPIMWNYFTLPEESLTVEEEEELMHTAWGAHCMAHNGWVMADDPLRNFAAPGSNIYLRRELIPWGDSVKLRYGDSPDDFPWLWEHMKQYVVTTAKIFHGVRLDNCHSTPIHVAEWMLDEARKVRPDLYVIAELFTSSEHMDNLFINRLGLNSLIREGLAARDPHDLGRLVHRYGGDPVGAFFQPPARPLVPSVAHAIFFDQTHDNPSPVEKRAAFDVLPNAALLAMGCFATGSNRGYDEIVPHHINVVKESRIYTKWTDDTAEKTGLVSKTSGIFAAKKVLNQLHQDLANKGFTQVYVDQIRDDVVAVTRHNPTNHQSVILAARSAFSQSQSMDTQAFVLTAPGVVDEILFEGKLVHAPQQGPYVKDAQFINGLPDYSLHFKEHVKLSESEFVQQIDHTSNEFVQEVKFVNFPPSSVIAFQVSLHPGIKKHVLAVRQVLSLFGYRMRTLSARNVSELSNTELEKILLQLTFNDLNRVMYRCDAEERDDGKGFSTYVVPNHGPLPYCGLQGIMGILSKIRAQNSLGHPLCANLREGDWMCDYVANRLKAHPGTASLGEWLSKVFSHMVKIPRYLIPCYFDAMITGVFMLVEEVAWAKMGDFISQGSTFIRSLSLGALQFCSFVQSSQLAPLSPNLAPPLPPWTVNLRTNQKEECCVSLAAGFPHFASGIFRNWGRDTFIALRGLLLLTDIFHPVKNMPVSVIHCSYDDARLIILAYGGTLRHGLIPNLLGGGTHARYNCRDAIWWWLQCIQQYCTMAPSGETLLRDVVSRMYPTDDSPPEPPGSHVQPLHDVIQEAMQRHFDGISYRERNAGHSIDKEMSHEGFNVEAGVDRKTGFVYGGNRFNCGTWMDKMGSSEKAGNKGKPATPRDGSAVEIVALCKSAVRWLAEMYRKGHYPYDGVTTTSEGQSAKMTFEQWNRLIQDNFEHHFWIGEKFSESHDPNPKLINQRCIYKDSVGASEPWTDYQLRPNFPVAMVVAPELFTPLNAWSAINTAQNLLVGPLGMKTLDSSDWKYNGNYDNSNDSHDIKVAKGWNYHQGPEWVWPVGYFLRAKLYFAKLLEKSEPGILLATVHSITTILARHNVHIHKSDWKSLPELTNTDGAFCKDSCPAQAWSVACLLEVLYDLHQT